MAEQWPVLAWTPFVDPIQAHEVWYTLLIPMALLIAVGYKSVRCRDMRQYPRQVIVFTVQIVGGIALLGLLAYLMIAIALPRVLPMPGS